MKKIIALALAVVLCCTCLVACGNKAPKEYPAESIEMVIPASAGGGSDLMARLLVQIIQDEKLWTKAAFEKSDFGTTAAVCVVTNGVSDDANGCNIAQDEVWLQIVRVGDVFCTHYSLDGEKFDMVRLFHLPVEKTVKVGIEAQSPAGEGGLRFYSDITLENRTVKNLRAGI